MQDISFTPIARIHTDLPTKFGVPRQPGLVPELTGRIVFEPAYRHPDAVRGLERFSHIWLVFMFSGAMREGWSATVRPPRLGGNTHVGVFASRSPFRPNPIGLSCVRLDRVDATTPDGPVLHVSGIDLMDGTPILDIKPYLPYTDSHPEATSGFVADLSHERLVVVIPEEWARLVPPGKLEVLRGVLTQDPRPSYQDDPERVYGFAFAGVDVRFRVEGHVLTVCEVVASPDAKRPYGSAAGAAGVLPYGSPMTGWRISTRLPKGSAT
jgi:tRNA-Thr(GGU) m(6)t(6)A37 methyltransferase TsaA